MTQDAPLDQKALEAVARIIWADFAARYSGGDFPGLDSDLVAAQQVAATSRAILNALFPASGGEAEPPAVALLRGPLSKRATSAEFNEWQAREVVAYIDRLRAASPIVAAPEGWRRAFLAYVEPEDAFTQLAIALCQADGNNPDATISIDGGPMQHHWHYYADEARAMLAAAPSIPEGKAEPVGQHDALPEYDPTSPLSVAEHIYAQCEQTVLSLNGLPEHSRDALISVFGHFKKLELAALSTPVKP